jgi:formylglycine-generating enzyme required for sulfatase activity
LRRGSVGRADLADALAESRRYADPSADRLEIENQIADLLGFARREVRVRQPPPGPDVSQQPETAPEPPRLETRPLLPTPFWRAESFVPRVAEEGEPVQSALPKWRNKPKQPPVFHVLSPWRELQGTLRALIGAELLGTEIDTEAVVEALSRGRQLDRLPLEKRRRWGVHLQVVVDRSDRLVPFWQDQDVVIGALRSLVDDSRFELAVIHETLDEPRILDAKAGSSPYRVPPPGGVVLVLGDLGSLDDDGAESRRRWRALGHRLASAGCRAAALLPCPLSRCPGDLTRFWQVLPWERRSSTAAQDEASLRQRAERLLRLVSPAVRIEPGFLRAVRRVLGPDRADAGTEADVWQHPALSSCSSVAASLRPDAAKELRAEFAKEPQEIQRAVLELLRCWRHGPADEIWFEEIVNLDPASRSLLSHELSHKDDIEDARRFFAFLSDNPDAPPGGASAVKDWLGRVESRATKSGWGVREFARAVYAARKDDPRFVPPAELDPIDIAPTGAERPVELWQHGSRVHRGSQSGAPSAGSLLGIVRSTNDLVQVEALTGPEAFWATGRAPSWASDWGEDEFGPWISFTVQGHNGAAVIQRLRWVRPGRFSMGSPDSEPGRWDDEGPLHEVTISQGFWIFETACSQRLWEAVAGETRSRGEPGAPVTNISWHDVQKFLTKINTAIPGLDLALPSEAQWEYACRAGTQTPYYTGTGIGRDLANFEGIGPVPVGSLPPNPWGLHEMHGNVFEWCADHWHDSYEGAPTDGSAWIDSGKGAASRVVRGGSWISVARYVRAAVRIHDDPADRDGGLGFRCARVPVSEREAASAAPANGRQAERRPSQGSAHAAGQLGEVGMSLPRTRRFAVRTDRDELYFKRITKPSWASAMGRDRFGLYADLTLSAPTDGEVVQRLRWIPPGRFWMGSPEDEEGRYNDEGPRHEVRIGHGYWLFDTPCTQALWEAVMGNNPSRFKSPTRPVESMSFEDAQEFLGRFEQRMRELDPDLGANARWALPSEAQWEYACRAGTSTATYAGEMRILGECNAPVLDAIAWYGGNSGVGFELDNGYDSSGWPEKQHAHKRAGTHPVGMKAPNAWGLYDMLGNVWEWCADHWHDSYDGGPLDGSAWIDSGEGAAVRVVRGGSWIYFARGVRAAFRDHYGPADRDGYLGFRCARVQVVSPVGGSTERPGQGKPARRSPRAAVTRQRSGTARSGSKRKLS